MFFHGIKRLCQRPRGTAPCTAGIRVGSISSYNNVVAVRAHLSIVRALYIIMYIIRFCRRRRALYTRKYVCIYVRASRRRGEERDNLTVSTGRRRRRREQYSVECNIVYFNLSFVTSGVEIAQKNISSSCERD